MSHPLLHPSVLANPDDRFQYVKSCALTIYYTDDWGDGCAMSLKDVDDYSTAILEKCATGDKNVIGGHAQITLPNCPGYVQIIHTGGQPPRGNPP